MCVQSLFTKSLLFSHFCLTLSLTSLCVIGSWKQCVLMSCRMRSSPTDSTLKMSWWSRRNGWRVRWYPSWLHPRSCPTPPSPERSVPVSSVSFGHLHNLCCIPLDFRVCWNFSVGWPPVLFFPKALFFCVSLYVEVVHLVFWRWIAYVKTFSYLASWLVVAHLWKLTGLVCAVYLCVQTVVWLPVTGVISMFTNVVN